MADPTRATTKRILIVPPTGFRMFVAGADVCFCRNEGLESSIDLPPVGSEETGGCQNHATDESPLSPQTGHGMASKCASQAPGQQPIDSSNRCSLLTSRWNSGARPARRVDSPALRIASSKSRLQARSY